MKVIILSSEFPPGPGGIGDHAYNFSEQLVHHNHQVTVVSELRDEFKDQWKNTAPQAEVIYFKRRKLFPNIELLALFIRLFFQYPDAVWIASGTRSLMMLGSAVFFFNRKTIAILHGHELLPAQWLKTWLTRRVINNFTSAIAVSEFSKNNSRPFIDQDKVVIIPNGFNPEKYKAKTPPPRQLNKDAIQLLTVGRISRRKGQHNVVSNMPAILKRFPGIHYHMVGMDDSQEYLKTLINSLNLQRQTSIHGVLDDFALAKKFLDTDLFIMLSENRPGGDVEGFGIAIIEANFFGIPAIGAKGCGIEQAIKDGFNGRLVNGNDNEGLVSAIEDIVKNYETYSANAIAWAEDHLWTKIIKQYLSVISKVKEAGGASGFFSKPKNYLHKDYNVLIRKEFIKEFVGKTSGKSILDIGCGDGRISLQFAPENNLTLVDASTGMLDIAKSNTPENVRHKVKYVLAKLESAPLPEESYDIIIAMGIFAHLESWPDGLKLLAGSLKKGGQIIIQISDSANWFVRRQLNPSGKRFYKLNHIEFDSLVKTCAEMGLTKTKMKRYGFSVRGIGVFPNTFLYRYTKLTSRYKIFSKVSTEVISVFKKV